MAAQEMGVKWGLAIRCRARWPTQGALKDAVLAHYRANLISDLTEQQVSAPVGHG